MDPQWNRQKKKKKIIILLPSPFHPHSNSSSFPTDPVQPPITALSALEAYFSFFWIFLFYLNKSEINLLIFFFEYLIRSLDLHKSMFRIRLLKTPIKSIMYHRRFFFRFFQKKNWTNLSFTIFFLTYFPVYFSKFFLIGVYFSNFILKKNPKTCFFDFPKFAAVIRWFVGDQVAVSVYK